MSDLRENTDNRVGRGGLAARSAQRYYEGERSRLEHRISFIRSDIARTEVIALREQLGGMVAKAEDDLKKLEKGWQLSSMKQASERIASDAGESRGHESRLVSAPSVTIPQVESSRAIDSDSAVFLSGYASIFNTDSLPCYDWNGSFIEQCVSGCFTDALKTSDTVLNFQHSDDFVMGRSGGTLQLWEDTAGLKFKCKLSDGTLEQNMIQKIQRKDIRGCSFRFSIADIGGDRWVFPDEQGQPTRRFILQVATLEDICVCVRPAYPGTSCWVWSPAPGRSQVRRSMVLPGDERTISAVEMATRKRRLAALDGRTKATQKRDYDEGRLREQTRLIAERESQMVRDIVAGSKPISNERQVQYEIAAGRRWN